MKISHISGITIGLLLLSLVGNAAAQDAQAALIHPASPSIGYTVPTELSADERHWFVKFQEGNLFVDGWQDITASILEKVPAEQKAQQKALLDTLGMRIGIEWCKDNAVRKVNTDMLKMWGKQLKTTVKNNPENIGAVLSSISSKVDMLNN